MVLTTFMAKSMLYRPSGLRSMTSASRVSPQSRMHAVQVAGRFIPTAVVLAQAARRNIALRQRVHDHLAGDLSRFHGIDYATRRERIHLMCRVVHQRFHAVRDDYNLRPDPVFFSEMTNGECEAVAIPFQASRTGFSLNIGARISCTSARSIASSWQTTTHPPQYPQVSVSISIYTIAHARILICTLFWRLKYKEIG